MGQILIGIHLVSAVLLSLLILIQRKGVGLGSAFGGEGNFYRQRRGAEKIVFRLTIVSAVLFVATAFLLVEVA